MLLSRSAGEQRFEPRMGRMTWLQDEGAAPQSRAFTMQQTQCSALSFSPVVSSPQLSRAGGESRASGME